MWSKVRSSIAITTSSLILLLSLVLVNEPQKTSAQFILVPVPKIPLTVLPVHIEPHEFFFIAMPTMGFLCGLYFVNVLPVKLTRTAFRGLLPFLDGATDRLQNGTATFSLPRNCSQEAMTVFDSVRCRFNQSAEFDYRELLRTLAENSTALTEEEQRQLWMYNLAREAVSYAVKPASEPGVASSKDDAEQLNLSSKLSALFTNEVARNARKRSGRQFLTLGDTNEDVFVSDEDEKVVGGDASDNDGEKVIDLTVEALVTSDWRSCLAELFCEIDKASRKYGTSGKVQQYVTSDDDNDVGTDSGWIFGPKDCSEEYKKCRFNFKTAARSLFNRR